MQYELQFPTTEAASPVAQAPLSPHAPQKYEPLDPSALSRHICEGRRRISDLPPEALSNVELVTLITGLYGREVLDYYGGLLGRMAQAPVSELAALPGMTQDKAYQLKAALELGRRQNLTMGSAYQPAVTSPQDVYNMMSYLTSHTQEQLVVLALDIKNQLVARHTVYIGTANSVTVKSCDIVRLPIRVGASAFVLVHNHPSGNPEPSPEDKKITHHVAEAAKLMDLELLDHVIIGRVNQWVSFKERCLL